MANDIYKTICATKDWPFLERQRTLTTKASTQYYNLPYDCDQVREIAVRIASKNYVPRQAPNQAFWDQLNFNPYTSDIPQWWFVVNGQLGLWPQPASAGNSIIVTQKSRPIDLSIADYTTGTITTSVTTLGVTTLTGSGTSWTAPMAGQFIRITYSDVASTAGDGVWYEISGVTSATSLTLVRAYGGTTLAAASAPFVIGQMPLLPEAFQDMPWLYAASDYWSKESDKRADRFQKKYDDRLVQLGRTWSSPTTDLVIDDGGTTEVLNPNLTISL